MVRSAEVESAVRHRERWTVPWWGWVTTVGVAVLLAAEIHLGHSGVRSWLPYVVLVPLGLAVLAWAGRITVRIDDEELRVDDAHIPLRHLIAAEALTGEPMRRALGPDRDPVAFVVQRPWVRGAVRVFLDDADDPTPYWIFSARDPEALLAVLDLPVPAPE